jgi:divalent metal cation (Fe/Co/Zn/Cd) transporter
MWFLYRRKLHLGESLHSDAIIADAHCTKTCFNLSLVLLGASLFYEILQIGYIDSAGALGIAFFAFREGREAVQKAQNAEFKCSCSAANGCSS